jgi:hypothetical protein
MDILLLVPLPLNLLTQCHPKYREDYSFPLRMTMSMVLGVFSTSTPQYSLRDWDIGFRPLV